MPTSINFKKVIFLTKIARRRSALYILLILLPWTLFSDEPDWIEEQIIQDLQYLAEHPTTTRLLNQRFQQLKLQSKHMLYCKIRNNTPNWKTNIESNENHKADPLIAYFDRLSKKHVLPDTNFIICLLDGIAGNEIPNEPPVSSYKSFQKHGWLLRGPQPQPLFCVSKVKNMENGLLLPDWFMYNQLNDPSQHYQGKCASIAKNCPWEKKMEIDLFRGSATGYCDSSLPDFGNERVRAVIFSQTHPELLDADFTKLPAYNHAIQKWYKRMFGNFSSFLALEEQFANKYLLNVDGYAAAYERCRWMLLSNSVLLKVEGAFEQWYYKAMIPWKHYVPIKSDLSDLETQIHFLKENDLIAQQIAEEATKLGESIFSQEKIDEYICRLLWAYSKYVRIDN